VGLRGACPSMSAPPPAEEVWCEPPTADSVAGGEYSATEPTVEDVVEPGTQARILSPGEQSARGQVVGSVAPWLVGFAGVSTVGSFEAPPLEDYPTVQLIVSNHELGSQARALHLRCSPSMEDRMAAHEDSSHAILFGTVVTGILAGGWLFLPHRGFLPVAIGASRVLFPVVEVCQKTLQVVRCVSPQETGWRWLRSVPGAW